MAEVGLTVLSASLQVLFERLASPDAVNFIKGKKLDPKLVSKLKRTLNAVGALVSDAEIKQIKDDAVKIWLHDVKDAVYEADDLLDELSTKAATQSQEEVSNYFSFLNFRDRDSMGNRIADIIERLEELEKQKDTLGLKDTAGEKLLRRPQSTSLSEVSEVYGRDKDKEAIINLLSLDDMNHGKLGVIAIVGMGGIGKTTLAQLVYNDEKVRQKFDLFAWVCVSEFDILNITKAVLKTITSSSCDGMDLNSLQVDLKEHLKEKKIFIVLDDVWNENYDDWDRFIVPFVHGSKGSKIVATTRNEKVASMIQTIPFLHLDYLSDENCWLIFTRHASPSNDPTLNSYLEKNRSDIMNKCKGVPLAAKLLGGLFRSNLDIRKWDIISKNKIWDTSESRTKVMPFSALIISYYYLPPHLKRCFVHCSLFPKDYEFEKDELILLWMAEDLLQPIDGNMTLEEAGDDYFDELKSRTFFQSSSQIVGRFIMHDLVHDLSTLFAGKFYGISKTDEENNFNKETRHMTYTMLNGSTELQFPKFETLRGAKALRTYLPLYASWHYREVVTNAPEIPQIVLNLKYMRVLSVRGFRKLEILPESICELIHLRYLDLSWTSIQSLPESIGKLYNLQTLKLESCSELTVLPSSILDLSNLRFLDVTDTPLQEMPRGMGKLKNLHYLSDFIISKHQGARLEDLGDLPNIGKSICIKNLEYVSSGEKAFSAKMLDKKNIESMELIWASNDHMNDSATEEDILDKLQPHSDLRNLTIRGYRSTRWPDWLGLQDMTEITLQNCNNCYSLPPLGQLPSLKRLDIAQFDTMVSVETEFYIGNKSAFATPFPSLEYLRFSFMPAWQKWCLFERGAFPKLEWLSLYECPKLLGDLPKHLPALNILRIYNCEQLASCIPKAGRLDRIDIDGSEGVVLQAEEGAILVKNLFIGRCKKLEIPNQVSRESLESLSIFESCDWLSSLSLDGFLNLERVIIEGCENLESIALQSISIEDKPNLESFSEGLPALNITRLAVINCPNLKSLPCHMDKLLPNLKGLKIEGCPKIVWHGEGDMPPHLTRLVIDPCFFTKFNKEWSRPNLDLCISGRYHNDGVQCFPEQGMQLPSSLTFYELGHLQTLETLDCNGLLHLTALQYLYIWQCPKLQKLVGQRLPSSVKYLRIVSCPLLEEQCRMKNAEIWPKISHIPSIKYDWS